VKPWADEIRRHVETWTQRPEVTGYSWIAKYAYHFTDVQNAASILQSSAIYSRAEANRLGLMRCDNASPEIIAQTRVEHQRYVRLYFRPKTPTQWHNEGIRPASQRGLGAHCAVPVFFCFDLVGLLSEDAVCFSDGNMRSGRTRHGNDLALFRSINFAHVYHRQAFAPDERDEIILRRHAEVLVPGALPLEPHIVGVVCRTAAERQTLLHIAGPQAASLWEQRVSTGAPFFQNAWHFVKSVTVSPAQRLVDFELHPALAGGAVELQFVFEAPRSQPLNARGPHIDKHAIFEVGGRATAGVVALYMEGCLAYASAVSFVDAPF
jgi:hypothetical protein